MSEASDSAGPRKKRRAGRTAEQVAEAGHSPGPWRVEFTDQYSAVGAHRDVKAADGTVLASVIGTGEQCQVEPETLANLNLIVASPELLAACQFVLDNAGGPPVDMLSVIRAAVAKAKGGAA